MKKLIVAPLLLAALFAATAGAREPAAAAPAAPEFGSCRWYCNNGRSFQTLSQCQAVCKPECEQIC